MFVFLILKFKFLFDSGPAGQMGSVFMRIAVAKAHKCRFIITVKNWSLLFTTFGSHNNDMKAGEDLTQTNCSGQAFSWSFSF